MQKLKLNILLLAVFIFEYTNLSAQSWSSLTIGTNNTVYAMVADSANNLLYVGGKFTNAGGASVNYLASWNGISWQTLPGNFNARIYTLKVIDGALYAGGDFTTIDTLQVNHIAKFNGSTWSAFGNGVDGTVYTIEKHNDSIYIGGSFLNSGTTPVAKIANWNGTTWQQVGSGMDLKVRTLKSYAGNLYAGGAFTSPASRIAYWNGSSWNSMSTGMDYDVYDIEIYNGDIIACGWFSPSPAKYIARWSGSSWQPLGIGTNGRVTDILVYNGQLYATGVFTLAGGLTVGRFAQWNATNWSVVGGSGLVGGPTAEGSALAFYNGGIYVGGEFSTAGAVSAPNIARWGDVCTMPSASFTYAISSDTVFFFNTPGYTSYSWSFGDATYATYSNPSHIYNSQGTYYICLTVSDTCATVKFCDSLTIFPTTVSELSTMAVQCIIYPNPSLQNSPFSFRCYSIKPLTEIMIYDYLGNIIYRQSFNNLSSYIIQTIQPHLPQGVYNVVFQFSQKVITQRLIITANP